MTLKHIQCRRRPPECPKRSTFSSDLPSLSGDTFERCVTHRCFHVNVVVPICPFRFRVLSYRSSAALVTSKQRKSDRFSVHTARRVTSRFSTLFAFLPPSDTRPYLQTKYYLVSVPRCLRFKSPPNIRHASFWPVSPNEKFYRRFARPFLCIREDQANIFHQVP